MITQFAKACLKKLPALSKAKNEKKNRLRPFCDAFENGIAKMCDLKHFHN